MLFLHTKRLNFADIRLYSTEDRQAEHWIGLRGQGGVLARPRTEVRGEKAGNGLKIVKMLLLFKCSAENLTHFLHGAVLGRGFGELRRARQRRLPGNHRHAVMEVRERDKKSGQALSKKGARSQ